MGRRKRRGCTSGVVAIAAVRFIAHSVNQQIVHELLALQVLTLLLETPEMIPGFYTREKLTSGFNILLKVCLRFEKEILRTTRPFVINWILSKARIKSRMKLGSTMRWTKKSCWICFPSTRTFVRMKPFGAESCNG